MRKYIYKFVAFSFIVGAFLACDNATTDFDGFDEQVEIKNIVRREITMDKSFYSTLVSTISSEDKEAKDFISKNNAFSPTIAPASKYIPAFLDKEFYAADPTSSIKVNYKNIVGVSEKVAAYKGESYKVTREDYQSVWGDDVLFVEAFTPEKSPEKEIPVLLAKHYPEAKEGDKQNVNYLYSDKEPHDATVEAYSLKEDFESQKKDPESGYYSDVVIDGWLNVAVQGSKRWETREYSDNKFANFSSFKTGEVNEVWLITPAIKLGEEKGFKLSFDAKVRFVAGDCLSVLISEDFDGKKENLGSADWKDITSSFTLPTQETANPESVGEFLLDSYQGKTIYVALKYLGDSRSDAPEQKTTTYQIDNITIGKIAPGIVVEKSELQYAVFENKGDNSWVLDTDKSLVLLQPNDYTAMGENYPNISNEERAHYKIPTYLSGKFPYEAEETVKNVVYYTWSDKATGEEYILKNGTWERSTWTVDEQSQFIRTDKAWVFDPTILINFAGHSEGYQMVVDYVKANQGVDNPDLLDSRGNAEFYYGFNAYYPNITYRDKDRALDPTFPVNGTSAEKSKFMNERTIEGLAVFLSLAYPDAETSVSGVDQHAVITGVKIYMDPSSNLSNSLYTYEFKCVGNKKWEVLSRTSEDSGEVEEYTEE